MVIPGDPAASRLFQRVTAPSPREIMPPPSAKCPLRPDEVATLRGWIRSGATWSGHWAYRRPTRSAPPAVSRPRWARDVLDRYVLARMEARGLEPSPEASPRRLLRRAALDLTGLPPTPDDLAAFESDRGEHAYERAVDRLLASPRFGEHLAARWLEAARYADTSGYQADWERHMWPWRDWVIAAFNTNLPFDRFTLEQLGRRPPRCAHDRPADRHRVQPQPSHQRRAGLPRRGVPRRVRRGPRGHHRHRLARTHHGLRALPRPQVRPDLHDRLLRDVRVLQPRPEKGVDGREGHARPAVEVKHPDPGPHAALARAEDAFSTARTLFQADDDAWRALRREAIDALRVGTTGWAKKAPERVRAVARDEAPDADAARTLDDHVPTHPPVVGIPPQGVPGGASPP